MREGGRRGFEVLLLTISDAIPTVFDHRDEDGVVILGDRRLRERKQMCGRRVIGGDCELVLTFVRFGRFWEV